MNEIAIEIEETARKLLSKVKILNETHNELYLANEEQMTAFQNAVREMRELRAHLWMLCERDGFNVEDVISLFE